VGFTGYIIQNLYTARREREAREYRIRRKRYEALVRKMAEGIHILLTRGEEKTTFEYKKEFDKSTNPLWLYASDDVLRSLKAYLFSENDKIIENAQNLILAMRKDLKIKTDLKPSEIIWFRAT